MRKLYDLMVIQGGEKEKHSWLSTEEQKECFIQEVNKKDLFLLSCRVCLFVAITVI